MAIIKSHTDLEQSKKLAKILPLESADMYFEKGIGDNYKETFGNYADMRITENMLGIKTIPCWSLSALLELLPKTINNNFGLIHRLHITPKEKDWMIGYKCNNEELYGTFADNFFDACYEMIIKLNEKGLL